MIKIEADNNAIEKNLQTLVQTVIDNGAELDPHMMIKCQDGAMSVFYNGLSSPRKALINLPTDILLSTEKMNLSVKGDTLSMAPDSGALNDVQLKLAELKVELYNLTDKIASHRQYSPWFFFRDEPEALEFLLSKTRTLHEPQAEKLAFTKNGPKPGEDEDQILCDSYIKTRPIGYKETTSDRNEQPSKADKAADNTQKSKIHFDARIMPVVDLINHHYTGAPFHFAKNKLQGAKNTSRESLVVANHQPLLENRECFAMYNQMDSLDSWLNYEFPDPHVPMVRAARTEIDIPKTGKLIINAYHSQWRKGALPQKVAGLQLFIPHTLKNQEGLMEVSHLLIPVIYSPQALRRVIRLMISNMTPHALSPDEIWEATLMAEEQVVKNTIGAYEDVVTKANEKCQGQISPEAHHCWQQTKMLAELQLTKLYKYVFSKEYYDKQGAHPEESTQSNAA